MIPYSTNNPQYFQYVASTMTRDEIKADPYWCQILESPFLGDQMELAIRYEEAQTGTFDDKKKFVEFYMANGPELDADTLLYYRRQILFNPTYVSIANTYYSDLPTVSEIREEVYGKQTTFWSELNAEEKNNCFKNPCDYLGPFSTRIGYMSDQVFNTSQTDDVMAAERLKALMGGDNSAFANGPYAKTTKPSSAPSQPKFTGAGAMANMLGASATSSVASLFGGFTTIGADEDDVPHATDNTDGTTDKVRGSIPRYVQQKLTPKRTQTYNAWKSLLTDQVQTHSRNCWGKLWKKGIQTQNGDENATRVAKYKSLLENVETRRHLGDCQRIWDQLKLMNPFDPKQNIKGPISQGAITGGQKPDGTPQAQKSTATEASMAPSSVASQLAAAQGKPNPADTREVHVLWWKSLGVPGSSYAPYKNAYLNGEIDIDTCWAKVAAQFEQENSSEDAIWHNYKPQKGGDWPSDKTNDSDLDDNSDSSNDSSSNSSSSSDDNDDPFSNLVNSDEVSSNQIADTQSRIQSNL